MQLFLKPLKKRGDPPNFWKFQTLVHFLPKVFNLIRFIAFRSLRLETSACLRYLLLWYFDLYQLDWNQFFNVSPPRRGDTIVSLENQKPFILFWWISISCNISNTEKWVEKRGASRIVLTNFEVFWYLMKHSFEWLI